MAGGRVGEEDDDVVVRMMSAMMSANLSMLVTMMVPVFLSPVLKE